MPLNNVNFPRNLLKFMKLLNKAVSFNLIYPTMLTYMPWDFTTTPPYYDNFGWLQYDSSNFYLNIGFITYIVFFMLVRQFIVSPFMYWFTQLPCCRCIRRNDRILSGTFRMSCNIWGRFALMTYFEFLIACFTGLRISILIPEGLNTWDKIALITAKVFVVLLTLFPLIIFCAIVSRVGRSYRV